MDPASIDKVTENIYIGNAEGAYNLQMLKDRGITHVLTAGSNLEKKYPSQFIYCQLWISDFYTQDLFPYFREAIEFIDGSEKILVHCAAGISRSCSMVIAYLMVKKEMSLEKAFELVKSKRKVANPNPGFLKQLNDLEKLIRKGNLDLSKFEKKNDK